MRLSCDIYVEALEKKLSDLNDVEVLIDLGIFKSKQTAYYYRKVGIGPSFFQLGNRMLYPKEAIIEWFKSGIHANSEKGAKDPA